MYLAELNKEEQASFLSLARNMVMADNKVTQEEESLLEDLHSEVSHDFVSRPKNLDIEGLCQTIMDPKSQAIMLLELASIAFVDGDYDITERELLMRIASNWGIERLSVLQIEAWGKRRVGLAIEAAHLIHEIST